ncbi:tyrosine phosphatase family protein [Falsochrobactrum sp. TDYN1]|uniref:Tyrosine phosphatase family protein n=1 Tax=Falsochrobactrum tianjinense TaxID=2706015 RepID=A0A949PLT3_9HYPH|nr:tyrosine phosphatase family protein [Falsochrobactrum sp. TDYN1]MBV2142699.1 tyrosine phosphatase family protein [Falsochrobactrum sp. TDYN1]
MPHIVVSPLSQLAAQIEQHRPSHIVTLTSAGMPSLPLATHRLSLIFNDIIEPRDGLVLPNRTHVEQLLDFAEDWDRAQPLLIHCYAGISRSTASAYIVALALNPSGDEVEFAKMLRRLSPSATPNMRLIELADGILERQGRMIAAIQEIGRGADAFEGEVFSLPV